MAIDIKKSHKGIFTKKAKASGKTVQQFANEVLNHKTDYTRKLISEAQFAKNAGKWNKAYDGTTLNSDITPISQPVIIPSGPVGTQGLANLQPGVKVQQQQSSGLSQGDLASGLSIIGSVTQAAGTYEGKGGNTLGNTISAISPALAAIPGIGTIASAAGSALGGIINMFGHKQPAYKIPDIKVIRPVDSYNPNSNGTDSSVLMKDGGTLATKMPIGGVLGVSSADDVLPQQVKQNARPLDISGQGDSAAVRTNNLLNITYTPTNKDLLEKYGAKPGGDIPTWQPDGTLKSGSVQAAFPTVQQGLAAAKAVLLKNYSNDSVKSALESWIGKDVYASKVAKQFGDKTIGQLTTSELNTLIGQMSKNEDINAYKAAQSNGIFKNGGTFKVGDKVGWNSEAGHVEGTITKVNKKPFVLKGKDGTSYKRHATKDNPQYSIKSNKSQHIAHHFGKSLHKAKDGTKVDGDSYKIGQEINVTPEQQKALAKAGYKFTQLD